MTQNSISYSLQQFFGGNFHEDWDFDADDWQGVIDNYCAELPIPTVTELRAMSEEIDQLRVSHSEDQLTAMMARIPYKPRPDTYKEWFERIAERLRRHAEAIENGSV